MKLSQALRVMPGEVVAFVGGGGKTTAMFRLAQELADAGQLVVTTTTTRIFAAQIALAGAHFAAAGDDVPPGLPEALARERHVLLIGRVADDSGKAHGVSPAAIAALRQLPGSPTVLIEADGSRMRPFKAPAEHEPVIPPETTLVVPVIGADVFGEPLTDTRVHRAELVSQLSGAALGAPVTPAVAAAVLGHAQGGLKAAPPAARVVVLINKVEGEPALAAARQTAGLLLAQPRITADARETAGLLQAQPRIHADAREAAGLLQAQPRITAVALAAARTDEPVAEVWGRTAAVVLAAGRSTRMGQAKQLLAWHNGRTMLGQVVLGLQASGVQEIVVVTGQDAEAVEASLRQQLPPVSLPVRFVFNPHYAAGEMAASLQAGLRALPSDCLAALVALADQPHLPPEVAAGLLERWRATQASVIAPYYQDRRGHPLLFDRRAFDGLLSLPADANPRQYLAGAAIERLPVSTDAVLRDIDTPDEYAQARGD